jgi:putative IMPACT (imprinted ancient) family translation regulator
MKDLLKQEYFRKATHNTYAYRIVQENGSIVESRSDDGEAGAGNCILRELQREELVNIIVVVTRYFGGVQLHADRFKNVIEATKIFLSGT